MLVGSIVKKDFFLYSILFQLLFSLRIKYIFSTNSLEFLHLELRGVGNHDPTALTETCILETLNKVTIARTKPPRGRAESREISQTQTSVGTQHNPVQWKLHHFYNRQPFSEVFRQVARLAV